MASRALETVRKVHLGTARTLANIKQTNVQDIWNSAGTVKCDKNVGDVQISKGTKLFQTYACYTVRYLVGFEIKPVRTVLKSLGIHRLLINFRANFITYNSQAFFLTHSKKLQNPSSAFFSSFLKSYFI